MTASQDYVHQAFQVMDGPWPDPRRFPVTRRLFAWWRWEAEGNQLGARNALTSLVNRTAALAVDWEWVE